MSTRKRGRLTGNKSAVLDSPVWARRRHESAIRCAAAPHRRRRSQALRLFRNFNGYRDAMAVGSSPSVTSTTAGSPAQACKPDTCAARSARFLCHDCVTTYSTGAELFAEVCTFSCLLRGVIADQVGIVALHAWSGPKSAAALNPLLGCDWGTNARLYMTHRFACLFSLRSLAVSVWCPMSTSILSICGSTCDAPRLSHTRCISC